MKVTKLNLTILGCVVGLLATAAAQPAATLPTAASAAGSTNSAALRPEQAPGATEARETQGETPPAQPQVAAEQPATATTNSATAEATTSTNAPLADGAKGLRPNFVDAPLRLIVDYLAKAAGVIVYPEVPLTGTITVQSDQPLTKDEAIDLFNTALKRNGYVIQRGEGRVLRIVRSYEGGEPIIISNNPTSAVPTADIVTQIVPVKNVDASSLISTLMRYTVPGGSLDIDASVGANAIVVRDSKAHIHRMLELIKALDNPLYSESKVRAFPLLYADAKTLAQMIKDLFPTQNMRGFGANVTGFGGGGRGGRGGGGGGGNPFLQLLTAGANQPQNTSRVTAPSVVATADDRSNTLIVMGSDEQLAIIADVVSNVDVDVEDKLEVRLFHLVNTDPQAVATYLQTLYPNPTTSQQSQTGRGGFGMRGGGFGGRGGGFGGGTATTGSSDRVRQETTVLAVADSSKGDLIVKASHSMLEEIADWLNRLDSDTSGQIVVKSWTVDNTDPTLVLQQLQSMFPSAYGSSSAYLLNQRTIGSQLTTRQQTQMNNLGRNTGTGLTTGSGSFGGSSLPSDRNIKTNFTAVNAQAVLAKVAALPISAWSYKADADTRHIGPMAQDFHATFQLGSDDKSIAVVDEGGVALAAIQGLNQKLDAKDAQIQALQEEVAELKALVQSLAAKSGSSSTSGQNK